MKNRVTCGEGKFCHKCVFGMELLKLGIVPSFEQTERGHCRHYSQEKSTTQP